MDSSVDDDLVPDSSVKSYAPILGWFGVIIFIFFLLVVIYLYWPVAPMKFLIQNNQTTNFLVIRPDTANPGANYVSCGGSMTEASAIWITVQSGALVTLNNVSNSGFLNYASATAGNLITCISPIDVNKLFTQNSIPNANTVYFRSAQNSNLILVADANSTVFKKDQALYLASYPATDPTTFSPPQNAIFSFIKVT